MVLDGSYLCFQFSADDLLIAPDHLRIVSRSDWLAQPVENKLDKIRQPVPWVVITHTATEHCTFQVWYCSLIRDKLTLYVPSAKSAASKVL